MKSAPVNIFGLEGINWSIFISLTRFLPSLSAGWASWCWFRICEFLHGCTSIFSSCALLRKWGKCSTANFHVAFFAVDGAFFNFYAIRHHRATARGSGFSRLNTASPGWSLFDVFGWCNVFGSSNKLNISTTTSKVNHFSLIMCNNNNNVADDSKQFCDNHLIL